MNLYIYQTQAKKANGTAKTYTYVRGYIPACSTRDGKAKLLHLGASPELFRAAAHQAEHRKRKRAARKLLDQVTPPRRPGRPRVYNDAGTLAVLGAYRRGKRIVLSKHLTPEQRASRRYRLLSTAWRERVSETQYVAVELRVLSLQKSTNSKGEHWDVDAAYRQAWHEVVRP